MKTANFRYTFSDVSHVQPLSFKYNRL